MKNEVIKLNFGILNSVNENDMYFKNALLETLKSEGDTLILGYGYYSNYIFNPYVKDDKNKYIKLDTIIDFEEEFYSCLAEGFKKCKNKSSTKEESIKPKVIIAGHMKNENFTYKNKFEDYEILGYRIYYNLKKKGIDVDVRVVKSSEKYHKKVAFKFYREKEDGKDSITNLCPVMLLIGSSNLTRQGIHMTEDFNQEVDVLFWNNYIMKKKKSIIEDILEDQKLKSYRSVYDRFIEDQMRKLGKKRVNNKNYEISKGISLEIYTYIASLREELDESKKIDYIKSLSETKELLIDFYDSCIKTPANEDNLRFLYLRKDEYIQLIVKNNLSDIISAIDSNSNIKNTLKYNFCYREKSSYEILKEILEASTDEEDAKFKLRVLIHGKLI